jgi:DNA-binding MarR family transcriptional regulator
MMNPMGDLSERDDLLMGIPPMLIVAGHLATKGGNRFIFGPYRMTVHHFAIMQHLVDHSCKMMDLRGLMFNSAANITQHVDALEERGWVRRVPSPEDRRVILVELTDKGHEQLAAAERHYLEQMREYMKNMDTDRLKQAAAFLNDFIGETVQLIEHAEPSSTDQPPIQ